MRFLWATRGKFWGFNFLERGGLDDPVPVYDEAFSDKNLKSESFWRGANTLAFRFTDPASRTDFSGRPIHHEIVIIEPSDSISEIDSAESGISVVWPLIGEHYALIWQESAPTLLEC